MLPLGALQGSLSYPFACSAGLLGSADPQYQRDAMCKGFCPAGELCDTEATVASKSCTPGYFCEEGSSVPVPCAPGTYDGVGLGGLASQGECALCPAGRSAC